MTQDNTPPGPIFKSRLLRTKHDTQYQMIRVWKAVGLIFPRTPCSGPTNVLMWTNRALKIGPGGVLSCATYGNATTTGTP